MGAKVAVLIDADALGLLQKPGEVVPKVRTVADCLRDHVAHLVNGYKGDDIFLHKGLVFALPLSEAKEDGFSLIDGVAGELGIGRGLLEAVRLGLKVAHELLDLRLVWKGGFEVQLQLIHLDAHAGHDVSGFLLIGHVADFVGEAVDRALDGDDAIIGGPQAHGFHGVGQGAFKIVHGARLVASLTLWGERYCA